MARSFRYNIVDAFTDRPLEGNPCAVFTSAKGLSDATMQAIAREMNLSETVFLLPPSEGGHAKVRIFTPRQELPFAGHPILSTAWVMGTPMELPTLRLETGVGIVEVELVRAQGYLDQVWMKQPLPEFAGFERAAELRTALGLSTGTAVDRPVVRAHNGPHHVLVDVGDESIVRELNPNLHAVSQLVDGGVLVFAQQGTTCFARYFAPAAGVNEDAATGSAAGPLGAFLVREKRHGRDELLTVLQGREMLRPSELLVQVLGEGTNVTEVRVGGKAVVVGRGELSV